ncbi:hypothetical protein NQZ79_g1096 [Umbelopsis isabellina]|nr:hypothetical protein NQZ79_g1096 [Umbelopsis isabellina]
MNNAPGSVADTEATDEVERLVSGVAKMRLDLDTLGLSSKGNKETLAKRLKKAQKIALTAANEDKVETNITESDEQGPPLQPFDYYLFFDVEATCEENDKRYPHEIIEFPVVLVEGKTFEIVDQFRSYVKPSINPVLTEFCTKLTGITQETVDKSPDFISMLNDFQTWMAKYSLFQEKSAIFVTDGPFDIRDFITQQCNHDNITVPAYFFRWVDIKKAYARFYNGKPETIATMLDRLGMEFEGRAHSGLDDATNIYRIARHMFHKGYVFKKYSRHPLASISVRKSRKER